MPTIDDFLRQHIDEYLLEDLANMAEVKPRPGETAGALGYPMISATLSGMELLGILLRTKPLTPKIIEAAGDSSFTHYWRHFFQDTRACYKTPGVADWLRQVMRNPLAHSFITGINIVVKKHEPARHFTAVRVGVYQLLYIDCVELYKDFEKSYKTNVVPILAGNPRTIDGCQITRASMQEAFEVLGQWHLDRAAELKQLVDLTKLPIAPSLYQAQIEGSFNSTITLASASNFTSSILPPSPGRTT